VVFLGTFQGNVQNAAVQQQVLFGLGVCFAFWPTHERNKKENKATRIWPKAHEPAY